MNTATKELISAAKARLMETFHLTEDQAHLFLIKTACDYQRRKTDVARDILRMESLI